MAELLPPLKAQFFDSNGDPLVGGKIFTYEAGTSTPKATYIDEAESSANTNPVILNSRGEAGIFMATGAYKFIVTDSADTEIYSVDNLTRPATGPQGISLLVGVGVPSSGLGSDGDSYINSANGDLYLKSSGSWAINGSLLVVQSYTQQTVNDNDTQDITGLLFDSAAVIEFNSKITALRGSARQVNIIRALFTGSAWDISNEEIGACGMSYAINSSTGQISYTSDSGVAGKLQWAILDKTGIEA